MSMISRRDFVGEGLGFAALTGLGGCRLWSGSDAFAGIDVPSAATPNYWCTWCTQDAALVGGRLVLPPSFAGDKCKATCRDGMNETSLFRKGGWVDFYPAVRSDLFLLLDDGWDVPYHQAPSKDVRPFGTLVVDAKNLPNGRQHPESPSVVPCAKRVVSGTSEGMLMLDGRLWEAHGIRLHPKGETKHQKWSARLVPSKCSF